MLSSDSAPLANIDVDLLQPLLFCRKNVMQPTGSVVESGIIQDILEELHSRYASLGDGNVASYIPELAKACPDDFGIAIATVGGRLYEVGDTRKSFTIQSISKPFAYGLGLKLATPERLSLKVDVEPSGEAFNAISLHPESGKPRNPMINAGAIAISAQISALDPAAAEELMLAYFSELAGRELHIDQAVYVSERDTGHRNRAIGHLLRNFNIIESDPEPALDLYFRQCAISVDCRDLAVMASTLACQGRNPFTGCHPLSPDTTVPVLALMGSCGMYDFAGQWLHDVGIPAKSGVAGGVLAVMPGRLGIAIYSPPLDGFGNSVRGVAVCTELSRGVGLSLFNQCPQTGTTIRRSYRGSQRTSRCWRSTNESRLLDSQRDRISVLHLQGALDFAALEQLASSLVTLPADTLVLILDLAHVSELPPPCATLLERQLALLLARAVHVMVCRASRFALSDRSHGSSSASLHHFDQLDTALEAAENLLISASQCGAAESQPVLDGQQQQVEQGLFARLSPRSVDALQPLLLLRQFQPGELVIREGDSGDELFLVHSGRFSTHLEFSGIDEGRHRTRLATFVPGMCFGEIAFLSGSVRTAAITAIDGGSCWVLGRADFDALQEQQPAVVIDLLNALACDLGHKLNQASHQLTLLEYF